MSQLSELSYALRKRYQNAGILHDLPITMERELVLNSLVLNYSDLCNPVEINCLCKFLSGNEAVNSIETLIIISKPVGGAAGKADPKISNANSLSNAEDHGSTGFPDKLLKAAILFIANSLKLHTVIIDSVRIKVDLLSNLGEALSTTKSVVRWLSFKSLNIGSSGIKVLCPHIGKMHIQVLVFERCGLCDDSCPHLSQIIKSQEAVLDSLFWNTTLRSDYTTVPSCVSAKEKEESDLVFSEGLVALSLMGNKISDQGVGFLRRAIHSNHWLLGLNLARNKIEKDGINLLAKALKTGNNALHTILLHGNPGVTVEDISTLKESCLSSPSRLDLMPKGVSMLLKRWMNLQAAENSDVELSLNNSNRGNEINSLNINGVKNERKLQEKDVKSIISSEQNGIKSLINIDNEYQDFKNGFESHETLRKIIGEESHLDVDQSWIEEDDEVEKGVIWQEMKVREIDIEEAIGINLRIGVGGEGVGDKETLSINAADEKEVNRYITAHADPRFFVNQEDDYQIQDIGEYRPPSRQSLKPRSQSLISAFASGSGLLSTLKNTTACPEPVYQPYVTDDVENWIGSPGHDLVQEPTWLSTSRNEILLDSRPVSASGTGRGLAGTRIRAVAVTNKSNNNRQEQFNSHEAFEYKIKSGSNIAVKSRLLKRQQESSAIPLRRHSMDGIHFTHKLRSRPISKNSSFSVRRQEEMSRRLSTGAATTQQGPLLSAMRTKTVPARKPSYDILKEVRTGIGKDKDGPTLMRKPSGNWNVRSSSDSTFPKKSPKGFYSDELVEEGEMDVRNRRIRQQNFLREGELSSNRKNLRHSKNRESWVENGITASEDGKRTTNDGFNQGHKSLDKILDHFRESVTGINKSLDDVSAQLRNVSSSLHESILERSPGSSHSRSQSNSVLQSVVSCPSSAQVKKSGSPNVRTSLSHSATTASIDHKFIELSTAPECPRYSMPPMASDLTGNRMVSDLRGNRVMIKVQNHEDPSTTLPVPIPITDKSSSFHVLGQAFGQTRESLVRHTSNNETLHDYHIEEENKIEKMKIKTWQSPVTDKDPSSLRQDQDGSEISWNSFSPPSNKKVSGPVSDFGIDRSIVLRNNENNVFFEDEYGENDRNSSFCSASNSSDFHSPRSKKGKEGKEVIESKNENENEKIISQSGISLLIRDRLKSKLESILHPNSKLK